MDIGIFFKIFVVVRTCTSLFFDSASFFAVSHATFSAPPSSGDMLVEAIKIFIHYRKIATYLNNLLLS